LFRIFSYNLLLDIKPCKNRARGGEKIVKLK
jgi:hypothetical protein